jgi:hypothetical protein
MRHDMQEVLITPGRRGSRWAKNTEVRRIRHKHIEDDETGWKQSMVPRDTKGWQGRKIDNKDDYLTPLLGYLHSKVGEKWDDVYSEIRKHTSADSTIGAHLYTHLWGYVERHPTYMEDGTPCNKMEYNWRGRLSPLRKDQLYVDREGRLAKAPGVTEPEVAKRIVLIPITSNTFACCNKKGIWFLLKYSNRMKAENRVRKVWNGKYETVEGQVGQRAIYVDEHYVEHVPFFRETHLKRDDFEILPKIHPERYSTYTTRAGYHRKRPGDKDYQYWYLIEYKTMSKKEKQKLGI